MFSNFLNFFNRSVPYDIYGSEYRTFVIAFGGMQFGKGLFNVFDKGDLRYWEKNIIQMFPDYKGKFELFGYDWMGRCFAVTSLGEDEEKILVFDPSTLEVNDISLTFMEFINKAIPASVNEFFSADAFINWYNANEMELGYLQCMGNKIPLFLGGADELENMELSDMDVYWSILGQTAAKIRGVEEGTVIGEFSLEEEEEKQTELDEDEFCANQANEAEDFFELQKKRAHYIKKNVDKYLEKFKKMHAKDSKVSWNWCGFLFGEVWFAYRKMYAAAIITMLVPAALGVMLGIGIAAIEVDPQTSMVLLYGVGILLELIIMLIIGMFSNNWYRKRIDKLVFAGENAETEEAKEKALKKGGVSIVGMIIFIVLGIPSLLTMFL